MADTLLATATTKSPETKAKSEAEKAFAKIEKPQSVKDYFVNNLLTAADRVDKEYNGDAQQWHELRSLLKTQALYSKENNGFAFFGEKFNHAIERSINTNGLEITKKGVDALIEKRLPQIHNFPIDQKVAGEFNAIVTSSLNDSLEARAIALGKIPAKGPIAATQVSGVSAATKENLATIDN